MMKKKKLIASSDAEIDGLISFSFHFDKNDKSYLCEIKRFGGWLSKYIEYKS